MIAKHNKSMSKAMIIVVLCSMLFVGTVGGVWAYLTSRPEPITNTFEPAFITCEVEEQFDGEIKSDVRIRNTGNVDAFIRAAVVVNFLSADGKVLAASPVQDTDYTIVWGGGEWNKGADGFWYCATPVTPDGVTPPLIKSASPISDVSGYQLDVQIIASAIQTKPDKAVAEAWGITPENGKIYP